MEAFPVSSCWPNASNGKRAGMVDRLGEIRYLREKAQQFRVLAKTYDHEVSPKLLEIAKELDARANALESGAND
jgi:hypothetical protein